MLRLSKFAGSLRKPQEFPRSAQRAQVLQIFQVFPGSSRVVEVYRPPRGTQAFLRISRFFPGSSEVVRGHGPFWGAPGGLSAFACFFLGSQERGPIRIPKGPSQASPIFPVSSGVIKRFQGSSKLLTPGLLKLFPGLYHICRVFAEVPRAAPWVPVNFKKFRA